MRKQGGMKGTKPKNKRHQTGRDHAVLTFGQQMGSKRFWGQVTVHYAAETVQWVSLPMQWSGAEEILLVSHTQSENPWTMLHDEYIDREVGFGRKPYQNDGMFTEIIAFKEWTKVTYSLPYSFLQAVLQSLDVSVNFTLERLLTSFLPFFFHSKGAVDDGISPPEITTSTDLKLLKRFSDIGQTGRRYLWVAGQRVGCCIQRRGVDREAVGTLGFELVIVSAPPKSRC